MRKLLTSSIVLSFLSVSSFAANANDYTVQIGAYQVLTNQAISNAEQHGEVYQSIGNDNLTRLHIGRFTSKVDALAKRNQLRNSGYNDAFITQISVASPTSSHTSSNHTSSNHSPNSHTSTTSYQQPHTDYQPTEVIQNSGRSSYPSAPRSTSNRQYNSTSANLSGLNQDEKSKAAFLDGQLRIFSEGQFYTLEQYRQKNR